jgi:hypothetical protein
MFRVVSKYVAEASMRRRIDPKICALLLCWDKHESPFVLCEHIIRMLNF